MSTMEQREADAKARARSNPRYEVIDRAEKSLWTDCFGEPVPDFAPYLRSEHGLPHSLLWDVANRKYLKRGLRWVETPVRGWRKS